MAQGISVVGNKKVETLAQEFTERYPYLRLKVCALSEKAKAERGETIYQVDYSLTIAKVRTKENPGSITISGQKKIRTLEEEFADEFGLYVQVCYTESDGSRYYTSGSDDEMTLSAFNDKCEANGCKKGIWR